MVFVAFLSVDSIHSLYFSELSYMQVHVFKFATEIH